MTPINTIPAGDAQGQAGSSAAHSADLSAYSTGGPVGTGTDYQSAAHPFDDSDPDDLAWEVPREDPGPHQWLINRSQDLPCGCETVAAAALVGMPGDVDEIKRQARCSVRSTLHFASCVWRGKHLLIVENGSLRRNWVAEAFVQAADGVWRRADMPPQMVCDLRLEPWRVAFARPYGICTAPLQGDKDAARHNVPSRSAYGHSGTFVRAGVWHD
jgi:hypothetical protein